MRPLHYAIRSTPLRPVRCLQALVESIETLLPERTVLLEPLGGLAEPRSMQTRRPQLRRTPTGDQPGPLEHLEVLGHRLNGDGERLGELVHRCFSVCEACEDRTTGRVGKSGKRVCELVDGHCTCASSAERFINFYFEYDTAAPGRAPEANEQGGSRGQDRGHRVHLRRRRRRGAERDGGFRARRLDGRVLTRAR